MGITGFGQWVIVALIILVLFGAGKIPRLMGDVAKGINAFRSGLKEGDGDKEGEGTKGGDGDGKAS